MSRINICSVKGCLCSNMNNPSLVFFCYPRDPVRFQKWEQFSCSGRKDHTHRKICSLHFVEEDFVGKWKLKPTAVPSILPNSLPVPSHPKSSQRWSVTATATEMDGKVALSDTKVDRVKNWTESEVLQLIEYYKENALLWDVKHPLYGNEIEKTHALEQLSKIFQCSSQDVQKELHSLRNQMSQELNKIRVKRSKGNSEENCTSSWKYFSPLQFLLSSIQLKSPPSNLETSPCETQQVIVDNGSEEEDKGTRYEIITHDSGADEQNFNKRRYEQEDETSALEEQVDVKRTKDDIEMFGKYVAMELRCLRTDFYRRRLKSEIRKAIDRIADEEDSQY